MQVLMDKKDSMSSLLRISILLAYQCLKNGISAEGAFS